MKKQMQQVWSKETAIRCVLHGRRIIWSDLRRQSWDKSFLPLL